MLKAIDTEATLPVVWPGDPAVTYKSGVDEGQYIREVGAGKPWQDYLDIVDGQPTIFLVGVIPSSQYVLIDDRWLLGDLGTMPGMVAWESFLCALKDIKNPGGLTVETTDPVTGKSVCKVPVNERTGTVDRDWLTKVMARGLRECALFVGRIAHRWNRLTGDEVKK
jgi:hypothetical protein